MKLVNHWKIWLAGGIFIALAGCATAPDKQFLTAAEKKEVWDGKMVKFNNEMVSNGFSSPIKLDKTKLTHGVVVCALGKNGKCYPQLSNLLAGYLAKSGLSVTDDKKNADEVVYFQIAFAYGDTAYDSITLMDNLEDSLSKGAGVVIDEKRVSNINVARDTVEALTSAAAAVLIGAAGGQNAVQVSTNLQQIGGPATTGRQTKRTMGITLCTDNIGEKPCAGDNQYRAFQYIGPKTLQESFPTLFDEAMKDTVSDIVAN